MEQSRKKKLRITLFCVLAFLIVLAVGFYIYTLSYYRADGAAAAAMAATDITIQSRGNDLIFYPNPDKDLNAALIFYPGGKVESTAYAPLLGQLAREGVTCVLVRMPFNLAFFNISAADRAFPLLPEIKNWYIGGHGLGGMMASSYVWKDSTHVSGLVLLGAYPFTPSSLPTLAVYGSQDVRLETKKLEGVKNVVEITGGNNAYFGNYGEQYRDGRATITREEQQARTVSAIVAFINDKNK